MPRVSTRYAYQRGSHPLVQWGQAAPASSRSAAASSLGTGYEDYPGGQLINVDGQPATQAMGSLGGHTLDQPVFKFPLPRSGAPEPLPSFGAVMESDGGFRHPMRGGMGCSGCGHKASMGDVVDSFNAMSDPAKLGVLVGLGVGLAYLGKKLLKK